MNRRRRPAFVAAALLVACTHPALGALVRSAFDESTWVLAFQPSPGLAFPIDLVVQAVAALSSTLVVTIAPFAWPVLATTGQPLLAPVSGALLLLAVSWGLSLRHVPTEVRRCWWAAVASWWILTGMAAGTDLRFAVSLLWTSTSTVLAVAWLLSSIGVRPAVAMAVLFAAGVAATSHALPAWDNPAALTQAAVTVAPRSARAHLAVANEAAARGDREAELRSLRDALQLDPRDDGIRLAAGRAYANYGGWTEAERLLSAVAGRSGADASLLLEVAEAAVHAGHASYARSLVDRASDELDDSTSVPPVGPELLGVLAERLSERGAAEQAARVRELASERPRTRSEVERDYALHVLEDGRKQEAALAFARALARDESNVDSAIDLAWLLATSPGISADPHSQRRDALRWAERAVSLRPHDAAAFDTLAAAQAESGDFEAAVASATRALELGEPLGDAEWLASVQRRIEEYRSGRPHRE